MQQKCSKLDHMTSMNNLVQKFYKSDHVQGILPTLTTQRFPLCKVQKIQLSLSHRLRSLSHFKGTNQTTKSFTFETLKIQKSLVHGLIGGHGFFSRGWETIFSTFLREGRANFQKNFCKKRGFPRQKQEQQQSFFQDL